MAHLPVIPNVSRVSFNWGPMVVANVMHFHQTDTDPAGLFSSIDAHVTQNMWGAVCNSQRVIEVMITPLDDESSTQTFLPADVTKWKGAQNGECFPQAACVIKKNTELRGRSARGRSFIGPVGEQAAVNGFLTSGTATTIANAWTSFQSAMSSAASPEVIASYKLATALTVVQYSCRNALGTMRLRQSRLAA